MTEFNIDSLLKKTPEEDLLEVTYEDFQKSFSQNRHLCDSTFKWHFDMILRLFNSQQILFRKQYFTIYVVGAVRDEAKKVSCSAYLKSIHGVLSATELTKLGLFGSARVIIRQVFEFLIIGKFASITNDIKYCEHWLALGHVDITRQILNKITSPDTEEFREFYRILCIYNHATSAAQQFGAKTKNKLNEIEETLVFLILLLECNYHLLNSHFLDPSMKYQAKDFHHDEIKSETAKLKACFKELRNNFYGKNSITLIANYKKSWKLRS